MPIDRNTAQYITGNPQQPTQSSAPGIWDIDEQGSAQATGRWPLPPNVVQRSLRFNSADSAYLSRTPAAAGNRRTWTWSAWIKRSELVQTTEWSLFVCRPGAGTYTLFTIRNSSSGTPNSLLFEDNNGASLITSSVYRDVSAWFHLVLAVDTTNGTPANTVRIYVNGSLITSFSSSTYPAQNTDLQINTTNAHGIGGYSFNTAEAFDGYMAEVNFVDGYPTGYNQTTFASLNVATLFGQTDAQTGQWIPRVYSGSYGTNGFRLQFLDNSGTTATTLGKDTSGLGNNWTPNNFSVAAGSGNDSLRDVPMNYYSPDNGLGGEVIGNYATLNSLGVTGVYGTYTNGNLDWQSANTDQRAAVSTFPANTGGSDKWYCEVTIGSKTGTYYTVGVFGNTNNCYSTGPNVFWRQDGPLGVNGTQVATGQTYTQGDVIGLAYDNSAGQMRFYKNGSLISSYTQNFTSASSFFFGCGSDSSGSTSNYSWNFGQRPFAYTAPSGFKALCTQNLPWSGTITTSGTFTGNASTDGPFVYLNGIPTAMTINGNAVTFGTQADKLSNGFKVRSSSASYNASGSNTYSVSTTGNQFSKANAQANP